MNLSRVIKALRAERDLIGETIFMLERLERQQAKRKEALPDLIGLSAEGVEPAPRISL